MKRWLVITLAVIAFVAGLFQPLHLGSRTTTSFLRSLHDGDSVATVTTRAEIPRAAAPTPEVAVPTPPAFAPARAPVAELSASVAPASWLPHARRRAELMVYLN